MEFTRGVRGGQRGGSEHRIEFVRCTPKALAVYREMCGDPNVKEKDLCVWLKEQGTCRRMADGARFFLVLYEQWRFVLCVSNAARNTDRDNPTEFCLVNVEWVR